MASVLLAFSCRRRDLHHDVVCAARQARAQPVGVVRTAAVVELSVVGVHMRLYGVLLQQIGYVLGV